VLIMYLWAALFSVTVVSLSVVRTRLVVFVVATAVAVLTLLPVTMPRLRPWRLLRGPVPSAAHRGTVPAAYRGTAPAAARHGIRPGTPRAAGPVLNGASSSGPAPIQHAPFPGPLPAPPFPAAAPLPEAARYPDAPFPGDQLPRAGRLPGVDPVAPFAPAYPVDPLGPGPASNGRQPHPDPFTAPDPFPAHGTAPDPFPAHGTAPDPFPTHGTAPDPVPTHGTAPDPFPTHGTAPDPFSTPDPFPSHGPAPAAGPGESPDPLAPPPHRDTQPW
jgi:hypothetical protein